ALVVEGTAVRIEPERIGTVVDEATATARVLGALEGLEPMAMELPTQVEQPAIYAADLEQGVARANAALDGPIVAVFEDRTWNLQPTDLVQFLTVEVVNGDSGANVEMTLDRDSLSAWLRDSFSGQVNRTPIDAQIAYRTGEGVVALEPSTDGVTLRSNTFADVVAGSFLGDQANIEVPVLRIPPEIDSSNLAALNINGLLGRGDSNYDNGQWDRDLNVEVGTQLMNGELIAPGEEFSFNQAVGEITAAAGFVDAGVIEAETIGRGIGGGVCQVSTTVFRAALMAGLPITEWHQHSLRLQGYERDGWTAGFDAAIFQQGSNPEWWADFKFLNDTDGYMLVQSWTDYPSVIVEIFGNDDGRSVDFSGTQTAVPESDFENKEVVDPSKPAGYMEQTQWPAEAYAAWFTRTVTHPNGSVDQRLFESIYDGSGNVYRVSPDMEGRSPASLFGP
ncbi:MAG: VanW family protein, partial [Chloroflexota bacterium]|nr:VanW family protein [Chloroflexota bacterium]